MVKWMQTAIDPLQRARSRRRISSNGRALAWLSVAVSLGLLGAACSDGSQTDPRELSYCGGTCYGQHCCADSHETCPELMPLEGSRCQDFGVRCGYGCMDGTFQTAYCGELSGWTISEQQCHRPYWDAGTTPDAPDLPDTACDDDAGQGDSGVHPDASVQRDAACEVDAGDGDGGAHADGG
jgi:hypothetical protein